jgi:nucleotide-binding universal stress UspA family protein
MLNRAVDERGETNVTKIVVGVDGSDDSKRALAWACQDAHLDRSTHITAVAAWLATLPTASPWFVGYDLPVDLTESTTSMLSDAVAAVVADAHLEVPIEQRVLCGSPGPTLIAESANADLLVVGSRGRGGFKGLLLGSVSHQVVTHAQCPVVVVPRSPVRAEPTNAIVVGVDGSTHAQAALKWAAERARRTGQIVHAVFAWQYPPIMYATIGSGVSFEDQYTRDARTVLESYIETAALPTGVEVVPVTHHGPTAETLLQHARHADLLVVGARGREGFPGLLLGSVTTAVAHHTPCPLAVIRAD